MSDMDTAPSALSLFDNECRVEKIIWIPGAVADPESTPDDFRDFVESIDEKCHAVDGLPILKRFAQGDEYPEAEDVASSLSMHRTPGFFVQAATPRREYFSDTAYRSGWGRYGTTWLYVPKEDEIASAVITWAKSLHEKDRQNWKASVSERSLHQPANRRNI